jgi:ABC-type sugar transport system ATPase subunit
VLVMREGTVAGELPAAGATEEDVLRLASTPA